MNCTLKRYTIPIFTLILIFFGKDTFGQDFNFSLFNQNQSYYNPAFVGMQKGLITGNFIYRKQWLNFPGDFSTKHFNADWKNYGRHGFGVSATTDIEGDAFLNTTILGINYSWRGDIDRFSGAFFQLGFKTALIVKKIDVTKFIFSDQLDEIYGAVYGSSFVPDQNKRHFFDFSVGGLVQFPAEFWNGSTLTSTIGVALHHFTRPNESFQGQIAKLPMKVTAHAQCEIKTNMHSFDRSSKFFVTPWMLFESRGETTFDVQSSSVLLGGIDFCSNPFSAGIAYRTHPKKSDGVNYNSLIFRLGMRVYGGNKKRSYRFFYAYDLAVNNYTKFTRDSHEIGVSIDFFYKRKYKCINSF